MKPDGRIDWHRSGENEFSSRLAGLPHDAWARLTLHDGEWWWRVIWERRFDRHGHCAGRQEASDAANVALVELLATTDEPAPIKPNRGSTDYRGQATIYFRPAGKNDA